MRKRDELAQDGCLRRAADDEPLFVIRAQDKLSGPLVRLWASLAALNGAPENKVAEALEMADQMDAWPIKKWPD